MTTQSTDPLTQAIASALNDRLDGVPGTIHLIDSFLDPALGNSPMDLIYEALDEIERRYQWEINGRADES